MRPSYAALFLGLSTAFAAEILNPDLALEKQTFRPDLSVPQAHVHRVAIIGKSNSHLLSNKTLTNAIFTGAGAAGSSAAFHIANFSATAQIPVEISIFERLPYIGGRSTTVYAFNSSLEPVELGASIFIAANRVLMDAASRHGLPLISAGDRAPEGWKGDGLGIWNGERFVFTQKSEGNGWWDLARLAWRYGVVAPWKVRGMVQDAVNRFLLLYPSDALVKDSDDHYFPWTDLAEVAEKVGLMELIGVTGEQLFKAKGISRRFWWEVVQAA
jgi:prenylcysteine oxidase/farnesylcysteine lyase